MPKRPSNIFLRGSVYWLRFRWRGQEFRRSLRTKSLGEARVRARKIREAHIYGHILDPVAAPTVRQFAEERWFPESIDLRRSEKGRALARQRMRDYVYPTLGAVRLNEVDLGAVRRFRGVLDKAPRIGVQTVHHVLSDLRALCGYAVRAGVIERNPVDSGSFPRIREKAPAALTDDQVNAILEHAGKWRPIVVLSLETGMRWSELQRLQWRHVEWELRELLIEDQKNGRAQWIPLTDAAVSALEGLRATTSSVFVVPNRTVNACNWVNKIRKRCGFKWTHHQLRHTCGTRLIRATGNRELVRLMLRHSSHRMTDRYARADRAWLRENVQAIGRVRREKGGE